MRQGITALWCALTLLTACGEPGEPGAVGDGAAPESVHPDAVWFDVLAVSKEADSSDPVVLAQTEDELRDLWARHAFDGRPPALDFAEHVVLGLARSEDNCPDDLVEARVTDGVLETTWLPPPGGCEEPLIPTAWAVAFHRGDLPESLTVILREHPGHGGDKQETITLPPYDGPAAPPPSAPARQMSAADLDAVFAGHALRPCDETPDPRSEPRVDGPLSADLQIAEYQRRRAEAALPSDEATVRARRDDPNANMAFGYPMTEEEFETLMSRNRPEVSQRLHEEYLSEHADTYGFAMIDQAAGGVFLLGFTGDLDGHRSRLAEMFPDVEIRVVEAVATARELQEAQQELHRRFPYGGRPRIPHSTGDGPRMQIGVLDPTRADLDAIAEVIDPRIACVDPVLSGLPRD